MGVVLSAGGQSLKRTDHLPAQPERKQAEALQLECL